MLSSDDYLRQIQVRRYEQDGAIHPLHLTSVYLKIVSEYDQEIPQSQTADNPVAPRGRAVQPSQDTRKTNKAKQPALSSPSKLNFLKVKFILISIPTIYLSYSYNPLATNTNLRAVTLVYPCSGLNIDSNDATDSPELKHGSAHGFIKLVNNIDNI